MTNSHGPEAGWYDDPDVALRLRWWDGTVWSHHTRPKPVIEHPAEQAITGHVATIDASGGGSTVIAAPAAVEPYNYSAPYSWSPGSAAGPDAAIRTAPQVISYVPDRASTPASWALAATPLVTALAQGAAALLAGFESTPFLWIAGAAIIPVLWLIMWVRRDRITLDEWGHMRRAHWAWAFLGDIGYLTARTIVVRRQTEGHGWAPLLTNLGITAVLINVGLFTPVYDVLRGALI
ncbi:DUF2510 domain-containing protein [Microcella sp.]|uniref:DUF2510 domain-containing protein n=1 Tax=Microcella sp. TaxID=1913979 RepID=UPI00299F5AB5|nr:DUF2510 domain-containing protein [Microcella sp.]MDX2026589.1 DUF2510 domain-containing protein [Microcella sp.]